MPYSSGLFDDVEYTSDVFTDMIRGLISDGVNGAVAAYLQVVEYTNMIVTIQDGFAWIEGHYIKIIGGANFTIATADGTLGRIDRVIIRLDKRLSPHEIYPMVLTGEFSDHPTAPALIRTEDVYDICLAEITVAAGTTDITQDLISDTRGNSSLCGYAYLSLIHI